MGTSGTVADYSGALRCYRGALGYSRVLPPVRQELADDGCEPIEAPPPYYACHRCRAEVFALSEVREQASGRG